MAITTEKQLKERWLTPEGKKVRKKIIDHMRDKDWGKFLVEVPFVKEIVNGRDLRFINLNKANLSGDNLSEANLWGADLSGADLSGSDLREANLRESNLRESYLSGANLIGADLSGSDLGGADLSGVDLSNTIIDNPDKQTILLQQMLKEIQELKKCLNKNQG